jgi:hypothetical protein
VTRSAGLREMGGGRMEVRRRPLRLHGDGHAASEWWLFDAMVKWCVAPRGTLGSLHVTWPWMGWHRVAEVRTVPLRH